jgi:hypothetical protein
MGADQGGPPDQLVAPAFGQPAFERLLERLPGHVRSVVAGEAVPGEVLVLPLRRRGEPRRGLGAKPDQRAPVLDQLGVPGPQPGRCPASLPFLEQPVALSQRAFVGRHRGLLERPQRPDRLVEEVASLGGIPDHDHEIVRTEVHRANLTPQVSLAPYRRSIDLDSVGASSRDLDLDQHLARLLGDDLAARVGGAVGVMPDHRFRGRGTRRLEEEQEGDPLEQVGLALTVRARDGDQRVGEIVQAGLGVVSEVPEFDPREPHPVVNRPVSAASPA